MTCRPWTDCAPPEGADDDEDVIVNDSAGATIGDLIAERLDRRDLITGALASAVVAAALPEGFMSATAAEVKTAKSAFSFKEVQAGVDDDHHVADGYNADILIRWGDPVMAEAPAFEPNSQTGASQSKQFGYNNDFLGYFPIEGSRARASCGEPRIHQHGAVVPRPEKRCGCTQRQRRQDFQNHVRGRNGRPWGIGDRNRQGPGRQMVGGAAFEICPAHHPRHAMDITGPAAGHHRMKTSADTTGHRVLGTMNNCAGGTTPWGTWLTCEENFNIYFLGPVPKNHRENANWKRIGIPGRRYAWGNYFDRFKVEKEANESNRFGWVVEIDPFDPHSIPKNARHSAASNTRARQASSIPLAGSTWFIPATTRSTTIATGSSPAQRSTPKTKQPTTTSSTAVCSRSPN